MAMSPHSSTIITLAAFIHLVLKVGDICACESPQYTEYGKKGIIKCVFISESLGIYWYESLNSTYQLVIRLEQQEDGTMVVSGNGYTSGMFDILSDGSLVITNVTKYEDQLFKVVQVDKDYLIEERYVEHFTAIFPKQRFPHISACHNDRLCLVRDLDSVELTCTYNLSRPAVVLEWYRISHEGEEKIQGETLLSEDRKWTFSSTLRINKTNLINGPLIAFVCHAFNPAVTTATTMHSAVIIDTTEQSWLSMEESEMGRIYFVNASTKIPCSEANEPLIIVWKKVTGNKSNTLMFAMNGTERFVREYWSEAGATGDGSLILPDMSCDSDSLYTCTFLEGTRYISSMIEVTASERCSTTATESKTVAVIIPVLIVAVLTSFVIFLILICCRKHKNSKEDVEQENANEMDSLDRVSVVSSIVTNENDVYEKHLATNADGTSESTPLNFLSTEGSDDFVEQLVINDVIERNSAATSSCSLTKEDPLEKLEGIIKSLMPYRLDYTASSVPFAKEAIDIIRITPAQMQLKKKKEEDRRYAIGALVFGLLLAPYSLGIGLLYAVTGFANLAIGLSSDELVTNEQKWKIVKPMLEKFITLQKDIAYIMALTSIVCEVIEFVQSNKWHACELLKDDAQNKLQSEINETKQRSRPATIVGKLAYVREVMKKLLVTLSNSQDFTDLDLGTKIEGARKFPFRSLCHNVSKCLHNIDSFGQGTFLVDFIEMAFVGDDKADISTSSGIIEQNVRKIIRGVAAAGIALKAAKEDTNLEFLEKELEELCDEDTAEYTVSLDDTVDLMKKMNAISKKLQYK